MSRTFEGRVALVTGGNSGIGRATAVKFAQEGARVVIAARRVAEGEETVETIRRAGGEALFVRTDVSDAAQVEAMVNKTVETYGRLDCAFNNAGTGYGAGPLHESTEQEWRYVIDVNLKSVWLCMKYEIARMLEQGGGAIVNDSSTAGLVGYDRNPMYAASKYGVVGLTTSAALQYSKLGIRVNAVCPGWVLTPMTDGLTRDPALQAQMLAETPIGRIGRPEEIAAAVLWLCSDAASYVTGLAMAVDGGAIAQ